MTSRIKLIVTASLLAITASSAFAQNASNTAPISQVGAHSKLTPNEMAEKKAAMKAKLQSMSPEQRKEFREQRKAKRQAKYDSATPEQQAKMREHQQERKVRRQQDSSSIPTQ